jgi:hypothetical protein
MRRAGLLAWLGALVPPFAWAGQHIGGYATGLAHCPDGTQGPGWHVPVNGITFAIGGTATLLVLLGGAASLLAFLAVRSSEEDAAPPAGRIYFLAVIGMTITPLFLAMVLMSSAGAVIANGCTQS